MTNVVKETAATNAVRQPKISPIAIIGALFFIFGFITWLNAVLIPYLRIACELTNFESYLVTFAFYMAYFVMALPSGWVLHKTGFKNGMVVGLLVMAAGALVFIPAALTRLYWVFLLGLFVQGTGLALLQTASNPYVTILGPIESAARRISIMGICNKVAGAIAPIVLAAVTLDNAEGLVGSLNEMSAGERAAQLDALATEVILPYVIMTGVLILLAMGVFFSTLPEVEADKEDEELARRNGSKKSALQFPHLVLGVVTIFLYIGVEVIAGDTIIAYGISQGIPVSTAKFFTTFTLVSMIVGYVIGIICIPKYVSQENALKYSAILGVALSFAAIFTAGYLSVLSVALLGLANALMWPAIWPLALSGLGKFTKIGSSLLIMGLAGGALIPLVYGSLADMFSPQSAYIVLLPCYLFIFYYATYGHKVKWFLQKNRK